MALRYRHSAIRPPAAGAFRWAFRQGRTRINLNFTPARQ